MARRKIPATPALRMLREAGVEFEAGEYRYEEHGGTGLAARALGLDEHAVIKTLVMEDESRSPLIVLMHGDREVSVKELARILGVKTVTPCDPAGVTRHTGYQVGGVSPFGTRKKLPVFIEKTILDLPRIAVNGGRQGLLVQIDPAELDRVLAPRPITTAR